MNVASSSSQHLPRVVQVKGGAACAEAAAAVAAAAAAQSKHRVRTGA
jgi:hypothetical protein